jgi:hypothetical protein
MDKYKEALYNNNYDNYQNKVDKIEDIIYNSYEKYYYNLINYIPDENHYVSGNEYIDDLLNYLFDTIHIYHNVLDNIKYKYDYRSTKNIEELYKEMYKPLRVFNNIKKYGYEYYE